MERRTHPGRGGTRGTSVAVREESGALRGSPVWWRISGASQMGHPVEYAELTLGAIDGANEDAVAHWWCGESLVLAIADGVGEHSAGQVASATALEVLGRELSTSPPDWPMTKRLRRAMQAANLEVYQKGVTVPELRRMATTLTVTAIEGSTLLAAHVGDCRLFLYRQGHLTQLTKDHTRAWEDPLAAVNGSGNGTRHAALSRSLGHELVVSIDFLTMDLARGDCLLQCSDGVHAALAEEELRELLAAHPPDAACQAIVRRAHEVDAGDDASAQLVRIAELEAVPPARAWWRLGF
jgi:serine/threonine protein phosphatase PrpC